MIEKWRRDYNTKRSHSSLAIQKSAEQRNGSAQTQGCDRTRQKGNQKTLYTAGVVRDGSGVQR